MGIFLSKTEQSNSERFNVQLELKDVETENLRDELFNIVNEAYSQQLKIYSDEKEKNIYGLKLSDRELIARMIAHILSKRGLDKAFIKLYHKKEVDFREGIELEILNREPFRLADTRSGKYVWRNSNIYDFYIQLRRIAKDEFNRDRTDLVTLIGLKILDKYSSEKIQEKYRASYMSA